ncbi:MAG: putative Cyclin-dependent kinase 7 [Streblomastix strix]|uniref:[RNA-polymerase]-subunit kinase n=1 Tax=Streblomastix strix TaxID=222440 RepID=A0A5J4X8W6_9EUKA|nr:MAG: putative Cyclin-dependent kinase 7 [Streblomastix strix]
MLDRYEVGRELGHGTYGIVYSGIDRANGMAVALKKLKRVPKGFDHGVNFTSIREIALLQELDCEYIIKILDFVTKGSSDIYIVQELMESDLSEIIYNRDIEINQSIIKAYMKMILTALAYCHNNFILHLDIKPANFLLAPDNSLKLTDFGFARFFGKSGEQFTPQLCTIAYRSPELLFGATRYTGAADIWSVGCIFGELMMRGPLFPGNPDHDTEQDHLSQIFYVRGSPDVNIWEGVTELPSYIEFAQSSPKPLQDIFPKAPQDALDLLDMLLQLDPNKRISASEALEHKYFSSLPQAAQLTDLPSYRMGKAQQKLNQLNSQPTRKLVAPIPQIEKINIFDY